MTNTIFKIRLKKGDTVVVRAGKDKGKSGKVTLRSPCRKHGYCRRY
jgi:ribosomal protein L24